MAKRGPKPTPFKVLSDRGSWRAKGREGGKTSDQKRPACPRRFINKQKTDDGEAVRRVAKSTWDYLAKRLYDDGLLVGKYRQRLLCLCDSFGRFELACQKCDEEGMTFMSYKGNLLQSPWVSIRNQMYAQVKECAACFGLTPADIAGVRAVEKPSTDAGKNKFFGRAG